MFVILFFLPFYVLKGGRREKKHYQSAPKKTILAVFLAYYCRVTCLGREKTHMWLHSKPLIFTLAQWDRYRVRNPLGCGVVFWGIQGSLVVPGSAENSSPTLSSSSSSVFPSTIYTIPLAGHSSATQKIHCQASKNPHPLAKAITWRDLLPDPTLQESEDCPLSQCQLVAPRTCSQSGHAAPHLRF